MLLSKTILECFRCLFISDFVLHFVCFYFRSKNKLSLLILMVVFDKFSFDPAEQPVFLFPSFRKVNLRTHIALYQHFLGK